MDNKKDNFNLDQLVRENVKSLVPYSSARDEFTGKASVYLDANENPFENGVNRYPDPTQQKLKKRIGEIKGISPEKMVLGNGSDEIIDLLFRAFCEPNHDNVIICTPTYGMYEVAAGINAVEINSVSLDENFQPDVDAILNTANEQTKMLFLCSPNNPTANILSADKMITLLKRFEGLIVVDEAYIDFAPGKSIADKLDKFPNMIVLQTLSKAWGMAGIRLGIGLASRQIIEILNRIKPPYNVNSLSQAKALELLKDRSLFDNQVQEIIDERISLSEYLESLNFVVKVFPSNANFLLVKVKNARNLYNFLLQEGIIIRDRSKIESLNECVRISIGTKVENDIVISALQKYDSKA